MPGSSAVFEGLFPSFLITFREALEAALIIAIMISYSRKIGRGEMNTYVYVGSAGAVLASLLLGFAVQLAYGELEGVSEQLFEGGASLTAVVVLTYMIFWMARRSAGIRGELEERMGAALTRGSYTGSPSSRSSPSSGRASRRSSS